MWNPSGTTTWLPLSQLLTRLQQARGFEVGHSGTPLWLCHTPLVGFARVTKRVFAGLWWTMLGPVPTFFTEDQSIPSSPASVGRV
jgi:hypothetical protein